MNCSNSVTPSAVPSRRQRFGVSDLHATNVNTGGHIPSVHLDQASTDGEIPRNRRQVVLAWSRRHGRRGNSPPPRLFVEHSPVIWTLPVTPTSLSHPNARLAALCSEHQRTVTP